MENISYLKIGQKGVINFDIPVYTIGQGNVSFAITCSVHGDETAGLFIVNDFLKRIKGKKLNGVIHIIPSANPIAQLTNSRVAFIDHKDLNRLDKGRIDGSYTERVVANLFDFLTKCNMVINIHEFEMKTPVACIFDNMDSISQKDQIVSMIKAFSPQIVWQINYDKQSEDQYQTTLDMALTNAKIINFAFETSQLSLITDEEIKLASQGLLNVAIKLGIVEDENIQQKETIFMTRNEVTNDISGLWEAKQDLSLMQNIKKGDLIGTITTLPDFKKSEIYSPFSGILMQYRHRQMISTGTSIFSIGYPQ